MADATGEFGHVPVLLDRCFALLRPALTRHHPDGSGAVLIDATVGAGGHAERFLSELPGLRLIGIDRDPTALDIVRGRLSRFADRLTLVQTRYDGIDAALAESGYGSTESVDGILFDLGVSSMQLDRTERGFSYAQDAGLAGKVCVQHPDAVLVLPEPEDLRAAGANVARESAEVGRLPLDAAYLSAHQVCGVETPDFRPGEETPLPPFACRFIHNGLSW